MAKKIEVKTNDTELKVLEKLLEKGHLKHKYAVRIQTILNRAQGKHPKEIAEYLHIHPSTISGWIHLYNHGGIEALVKDKTRKPGKKPISISIENKICSIACSEKPKDATHWSNRALAKHVGVSHNAINIILRKHGIKPHLVKRFRTSNDPQFTEKLTDIVGLYLNPPENALILSTDEKSQIQALERMQPILPLRPGLPERQTHDYYRHGTTTLFAAIEVLSGQVIGECRKRHCSEDFICFLKRVDKNCDKTKTLHIVLDNISSHKTKKVYEYLESKKDRFVFHFTPTHSSWLNIVERWFAEITNKRIRRGSWNTVKELEKSILDFIRHWNKSGKKFTWSKSAKDILDSLEKAVTD
jgi:transposase